MEKIVNLACANKYYLAILLLPYLSYMLYDFFQKGMVFEFYGNWLFRESRWNEKVEKGEIPPVDMTKGGMVLDAISDYRKNFSKKEVPWYKKPLGECLKCFHVWICILFSLFFNHSSEVADFLKFIISLSVSYHILIKKYF